MVDGQWLVVSGRWSTVDGQWSVFYGQKSQDTCVCRHRKKRLNFRTTNIFYARIRSWVLFQLI